MEQGKRETSLRFSNKAKLIPRDISESLGKLPPQAIDIEEAILGAAIIERQAQVTVLDKMIPDDFYLETNKELFQAMVDLAEAGSPIDMKTVRHQLDRTGKLELIGGAYRIAEITAGVSSAANVEFHCTVVIQKRMLRDIIQMASQLHYDAYEHDGDPFKILDQIEAFHRGVVDKIKNTHEKNIKEGIDELVHEIQARTEDAPEITGVPSGYSSLDRITQGWQDEDLVIIGARPSMGKTTLSLNFLRNASVDFKLPTAIFSMEMGYKSLVHKLVSMETSINQRKLKSQMFQANDWHQFMNLSAKLAGSNIIIDDTAAISITDLRMRARKLVEQAGVKLIVVDYLQLMRGPHGFRGNREQEISEISRGLKQVAKELKIPVLALSQLSRKVDERGGDKRPIMSDLRDSGSIEQDADIVMFLWRPEYYKIQGDEGGTYARGLTEMILAKHRNGTLGNPCVAMEGSLSKFRSVDSPYMMAAPPITPRVDTYDRREPVEENTDDLPF